MDLARTARRKPTASARVQMSVYVRFYVKLEPNADITQVASKISSAFACANVYVIEKNGLLRPIEVEVSESISTILPRRTEYGDPITATDVDRHHHWFWIHSHLHWHSAEHTALAEALPKIPGIAQVAFDNDCGAEYQDSPAWII